MASVVLVVGWDGDTQIPAMIEAFSSREKAQEFINDRMRVEFDHSFNRSGAMEFEYQGLPQYVNVYELTVDEEIDE